jgi:RNA polymerase sigma factor (sigma-70 family)
VDYERVVLENLPLIDAVVRSIARRHGLSADDAGELNAAIRLKLVDRNYEVLRRFKEESSLRTYLNTVVNRYFLDTRIASWGKWRPSALARRQGPHAVLLDQFMTRDGLGFDDAASRVMAGHPEATRAELESIAALLPQRVKRRFTDDTDLAAIPSPASERDLIDSIDNVTRGERIQAALSAALAQLPPQDRIVLKMRFCDDFTVARISQLLGLPQKPLYRRITDIMRTLRTELEKRGVEAASLAALFGHAGSDLDVELGGPGENRGPRPSLP